jgi:acyl-CoA thioester hydrolase
MTPSDDGWFRHPVPVRFRDLDPMGHAHHTLPLIYLEEARAVFWGKLAGDASLNAIDYVMAEVTLRFHARITFPGTVTVLLGVTAMGRSSFTMAFEIRSADDILLASGSAVQVAYDYAAARSKPIGAAQRARLAAWQDARDASLQKSSAMPADTAPIIAPSR